MAKKQIRRTRRTKRNSRTRRIRKIRRTNFRKRRVNNSKRRRRNLYKVGGAFTAYPPAVPSCVNRESKYDNATECCNKKFLEWGRKVPEGCKNPDWKGVLKPINEWPYDGDPIGQHAIENRGPHKQTLFQSTWGY